MGRVWLDEDGEALPLPLLSLFDEAIKAEAEYVTVFERFMRSQQEDKP